MTEITKHGTMINTETNRSGRSNLALRPTSTSESQREAATEAYLADQKAQQAMSRGGRDYLDIDKAYDLGVGVKSNWINPHESTTTTVRQVDPAYKASLDRMKDNGTISEETYNNAISSALGIDPHAEAPPEADVERLEFDKETSDNARWVQGTVGESKFNAALTAYVMGDSTPALDIASHLTGFGVTAQDMTGLYDSMANQALSKIADVMEANGDTDVDVYEMAQWAKGLERGQTRELATSVLASAMYNRFNNVPEVAEAFRRAKSK
uniref:hypothetical protein n=1 Tax=Microbulbifer agarilyticus TaxID=260552 RepID=UPI0002559177|nr:hypothetical protein [Microbulbifer agarilyticus]